MTYSIVTSSKTGNTQAVADAIAAALPPEGCVYRGAPAPEALDADVIFAGFWTDKGTCAQDMAGFLPLCGGKKVALFGTAGFGGDPDYFNMLLENVKKLLPSDAVYLGGWIRAGCQAACARFAAGGAGRRQRKTHAGKFRPRSLRTDLAAAAFLGKLVGTPLRLNLCKAGMPCGAAMGKLVGDHCG